MLTWPPSVRVFVAVEPLDMRGSFDALAGAVRRLGLEPVSGHLYLFLSRNRRIAKRGVAASRVKAVDWSERACTKEHTSGCFNLGVLFLQGGEIPEDLLRAAAMFERVCTGDQVQGCVNVALMFQRGQGVPKDEAKAKQLLERACSGGVANACGR